MTIITKVSNLPQHCWPVHAIDELEQQLCQHLGCEPLTLMAGAGATLFTLVEKTWPQARHCLVLCGDGENGGYGFAFARLAQQAGLKVTVVDASAGGKRPAKAMHVFQQWQRATDSDALTATASWPQDIDIIVDALCGIGIQHSNQAIYAPLIQRANQYPAPILAVDLPSGLNADTGQAAGDVIKATATLTFLTLKPGLLTGQGRAYCGKLHYADLGFSRLAKQLPAPIECLDASQLSVWLPARKATAHKGDMGKLVLIGGATGTAGAIRLAGEAALRSGAGLVKVLTHASNIVPLLVARPELMTDELTEHTLEDALAWADTIAIGPGLGQSEWAKNAVHRVKLSKKPMLWDADALNILAIEGDKRQNRLLTPHPGEAARLLAVSVADVEADRLAAARKLVDQYGGVVVLKGAGTLIAAADQPLAIANVGNPGMASGGMGDALTGIIAGLLAQKLDLWQAACAGVVAHGHTADQVASHSGMRGMLASDVIDHLRKSINPETNNDKYNDY